MSSISETSQVRSSQVKSRELQTEKKPPTPSPSVSTKPSSDTVTTAAPRPERAPIRNESEAFDIARSLKNRIPKQASDSFLAQANQTPEGVQTLLKA